MEFGLFDSFAGIGGYGWSRTGFTKIANAQIRWFQRLNVAVVKQTDHASVVARRVMALVGERQPRRARRRGNTAVGTARTSTMIPNNEPFAALGHKAVALADRTAGAVIHSITALPLRFHRAFENVCRSEIGREQAQLKTRARR